jgi:nucleoside-diphosphate-sugar epimerase
MGYVLAVMKTETHNFDSFNFGPKESSLKVSEVIQIANENLGGEFSVNLMDSGSDVEAKSLELDSERACTILEWKPFLSQAEAIHQTLNWWKLKLQGSKTASALCSYEISLALNSYS